MSDRPMICIVDDDDSVRDATSALVRSLGYATRTFASAEDYLRSDQIDDTDCLISDMQMPGLSGAELQERLLKEGRHMPVIFITAFPDEHLRTRVLDAGALAYLSKPVNDEHLIVHLNAALARS